MGKEVEGDMEKEMKTLRKKRGIYKAKLTSFDNYLHNVKENNEELSDVALQIELKLRLQKIENLYNDFDTLQDEMDSLLDEPELDVRDTFEKQYFSLVSSARALLEGQQDHETSEVSSRNAQQFVRLPKIDLPHFNGCYQHWLEFRDTFISLIHTNDSIDPINKFHYLRASLQGSAALVIKSLDFKSANYSAAWDLLCERFDNKRLLVNNHVQALFNVTSIQKESSKALRYIVDVTNKNLRALATLGQPTDHWDTLVIYMMSTKLDSVTSREWEERRNSMDDPPTLDVFVKFLTNRADLLETIEESKPGLRNRTEHTSFPPSRQKSFIASISKGHTNSPHCPLCKNHNHQLYSCESFRGLSVEARNHKARELKVCLNCLRVGHFESKCKLSHCKYCKLKHNTLLHFKHAQEPPVQGHVALSVKDTNLTAAPQILLSTALVKVLDCNGTSHVARLLLDNGSTANFITQDLCHKLGLQTFSTHSNITGINNLTSRSSQRCSLTMESYQGDYRTDIDCFILPNITSVPNTFINTHNIQIPTGICLADPTFHIPSAIDILVGADLFWNVIGTNRIQLGKHKPTLFETKLGWLVSGTVHKPNTDQPVCMFLQDTSPLSDLSRFWELDTISPKHDLTLEERACEQNFINSTTRNSDGRFVVTLPLKETSHALGNSFQSAKNRFLSLERRLEREPDFKEKYVEFIKEYIHLGHMSINTNDKNLKTNYNTKLENIYNTNTESNNNTQEQSYYLPHHGVLRESSTTTKLRVVFDASAVTTSGKSFNDIQRVGPTVQDDLLSILLRFRQHKYVVSSDILKMYRQVEVHPSQRSLQQIIWRFDPSEQLSTYTLNTLTYGTSSASYLATRCLRQLGLESNDDNVRRAICRDFYVDDLLTGLDEIQDTIGLCHSITDTLRSAKMELHKWHSNNQTILQAVCDREPHSNSVNLSENELSKTLGLSWCCTNDTLTFQINVDTQDKVNKRIILSTIAQVFDPLGLVAPCIVEAKILMQQLWKLKCSWDEEVPHKIKKAWLHFAETLHYLNNLNIPRHVISASSSQIEIHTFTDASECAYGACVYIRSIAGDAVTVRLLVSKSKVAPIKPTTTPRLELCGALLGSRLYKKVVESVTFEPTGIFFWTDSTIVLGWLSSSPQQLKSFVRHRVSEIQEDSGEHGWRYVPTKENPADLVSRGVSADELGASSVWWTGPAYLKLNQSQWPTNPNDTRKELPEIIQTFHSNNNSNLFSTIIHSHSNITKLQRVIAFIFRFINIVCRKSKVSGRLSTKELRDSLQLICRIAQQESFPDEYKLLASNKELPHKNRLLNLSPFLDTENLIRVGGRLNNSSYDYNVKHPILLCSNHHVTKLILQSTHITNLHCGPQLLLALVRHNYWPVGGTNLSKRIVRACVTCNRHKSQNAQPIMGDLPKQRVHLEFPFLETGVDYAGPVMIANRKGRGSTLIKSYICVFVCLATKAVHLELVSDLSKEGFIAALNRFISRRGKPRNIFSDHGTTFVGASNELHRVIKGLKLNIIEHGINFSCIPAYTPHFGGLWESAVKSTKYHLRRVLRSTHLTYEEMATLLVQVEGILNSRPLTPLSDDPSDLYPLTPAHLLIGRSLICVPHPQIQTTRITSLQRFQRIEFLKQQFWSRFSNEYILLLQQRTKWQRSRGQLKQGTLVLVKDKALPPLMWLLGRIIRTLPGQDGVARVADIRTKKGIIRRAFNNICPLPLESIEDTSTRGVYGEDEAAAGQSTAATGSGPAKEGRGEHTA